MVPQRRFHLGWHVVDEALRRGAVVELDVGPKRAEHRGKQALARAVETRDPRCRNISTSACRRIEGIEDAAQRLGISALADKGLQLLSKDRLLLRVVGGKRDLGNTTIRAK